MADAFSYLTSEVRPVMERRPGNLGTSLLLAPEAGAMGLESFWASNGALMDSGDVIAAGVGEAAQRAGGTVTRERYRADPASHQTVWRKNQRARPSGRTLETVKHHLKTAEEFAPHPAGERHCPFGKIYLQNGPWCLGPRQAGPSWAGGGSSAAKEPTMKPAITGREAAEDEELLVHDWRVTRLA